MTSYSETIEVSKSSSGKYYARVSIDSKGESSSVFLKFDKEPTKESIEAQAASYIDSLSKARKEEPLIRSLPVTLEDF